MSDRFSRFPADLARRTRSARLGPTGVPALLAHPDWERPAPVVLWMHGRTVNKELDPGRYLRWVRAGIAACSIDLPGHGERLLDTMQAPEATLDVLDHVLPEIDHIVEALADPEYGGLFDLDRLAIGGMSLGGMATLRRLCDPHPFRCAAVESTCGDLGALFEIRADGAIAPPAALEALDRLDPLRHLDGFRPIPLLALHTEADRSVPFAIQRNFLDALRAHYRESGADESMIELMTWPQTGAPNEHAGFGRFANEAKNVQVDFLRRHLNPSPPQDPA